MLDFGALRIGDVVDDKYEVEALVGRGGMGVVYRARHIQLNVPRAIKVMHRELAENEDFLARFRNEAKLAEELRHPNLVTLYDLSPLPDGTPYIVWEYVEGDTLSSLLNRGVVFAPWEVAELVGQVADGLAAAHRRQILHRDVSPDNLMVTRDAEGERRLKVLDFGMAKVAGTISHRDSPYPTMGVFLGKIGYSSPEQVGILEDDEKLDGRTDVFSLAVVAYRMLTGRLPFRTATIQGFLYDLTTAPESEVRERFERDLAAAWRPVFSRALLRDRKLRTPKMEELKRDIEEAALKCRPPARASGVLPAAARKRVGARLAFWGGLALSISLVSLWISKLRTLDTPPSLESTESAPAPELPAAPPPPAPNEPETGRRPDVESSPPAPSKAAPIESPPLSMEPPHIEPQPVVTLDAGLPALAEPRVDVLGSLSVTSDIWAEVRLDEGPPEQTPILFRRVPVGRHRLLARRPGFEDKTLEVDIREGETATVHLRLDPEP